MGKVRIYDLAKKLGKSNKEIIDALAGLGIPGKTPSSSLEDDGARKLEAAFAVKPEKKEDKKEAPRHEPHAKPVEQVKKEMRPQAPQAPIKEKPVGERHRPHEARPQAPQAPHTHHPKQVKPAAAHPQPKAPQAPHAPKAPQAPQATAPSQKEAKPEAAQAAPSVPVGPQEPAVTTEGAKPAVTILEEEVEGKVPEKFIKEIEAEKVEKFKAKPGMQRAFQAIRKVDQKKWVDRRGGFKKGGGGKWRPGGHVEKYQPLTTAPRKKTLKIQEGATVKEFAELISVKLSDVIKKFMGMGYMPTINQPVDLDAALLVAESFGAKLEVATIEDLSEVKAEAPEDAANLIHRPPVVTIMGHVDHGKTSLLDAIRETRVTEKEAGGITQHIGAYKVSLEGKDIVFLDTPGHEAFTALRARGAKVTDIVVLVVAADDGVKPQTVEAINHAKAAGVPIIVAVNKIDKPDANPAKVRGELAEHEIIPEDWGGKNIFAEISAKKRIGIESLLELILLQAEMLELKANPQRHAKGVIIESRLDKGRGPMATVLVQTGTLKAGDAFLSGTNAGRVRALIDDTGKRIQEAGPSTPVEVIGFGAVPNAGEVFLAMDDERKARQIAMNRLQKQKFAEMAKTRKLTLDDLYAKIKEGAIRELNIVIKGDVQGSVEAMKKALEDITHPAVKVRVLHSSVGGINDSDVMLAAASNAIIIGFNVRPEIAAAQTAEKEGVDVRLYNIIYEAIEDVRKALEGLLEPTLKEKILGRAEVRQTFAVSRLGTIAGCMVIDGAMSRTSEGVRIIRDNIVVYEGKLSSLKRFKEDVKEVQQGYECGIMIENFNDLKVGDIIENFIIEKIAGKL